MNTRTRPSFAAASLHALRRLTTAAALLLTGVNARASIAYGSINNFDTVNDTGHECHGFEIELEDCRSTDITYTYNYNHYGTPKIITDDSVAGHPKCIIRWESKKNADGSWAAYTAIPAGPISPTNGHMFTNPSINFGGEHFGAGYTRPPSVVRYHWLIDDGAGALINGGDVQVSTPVFTYYPPAAGAPAQVQAEIRPPAPPEVHVKEFGDPVWMKEIRTTSHSSEKIRLRELVSDDPDDAGDKNWKNGEPDEVETEWQLLQVEFNKVDGGVNGKKAAAPENLNHGDEVVTRRYEFYKYTGPTDNETGEAMCENVDADNVHGSGTKTVNGVETDLSTLEVVGDFTGAQMAAVDVEAAVGLIEHVSEGKAGEAYADRTLVVQGATPFSCTREGALPAGMTFNEVTGVLSGTPAAAGQYQFKVTAADAANAPVAKNYTLAIAPAGLAALPPSYQVDTAAVPADGGTTSGDGSFAPDSEVTVTAVPGAGYRFLNWTENGQIVSTGLTHTFTLDINHTLAANFTPDVPQWTIATSVEPADTGTVSGDGTVDDGTSVTLTAAALAGYSFANWTEDGTVVSTAATYPFTASADRTLVAHFSSVPLFSVNVSAAPAEGGSAAGTGSFVSGSSVTVTATPGAGYVFARWTSGANQVSVSPVYTFTLSADRNLVANFVAAGAAQTIAATASPLAGGTISGTGTYSAGDTAELVATPAADYKFNRWREGGATVSNSSVYSFTVAGSRTLSAQFTEAFVVHTTSSPSAGGDTEADSADYKSGENARVKAFPAAGYSFLNWTDAGVVVSTSDVYDFSISESRDLVANFVSDTGVTITTAATPAAGGTISGDGAYDSGADVILSALPNEGYAFSHWSEGGAVVSTDADYLFTADANRTLTAHFAPAIAINASAVPAAGGWVSGGGDYASGAAASLEAVPEADYAFRNWTEDGVIVSTDALYGFTVAGPRTLVANFTPAWTISAGAWPVTGGTTGGAGTVVPGSSITLVATAATGYTFENWTDPGGIVVSSSPSYTFTPAASGEYTANFTAGVAGVHFTFDTGSPLLALHAPLPFTQTVGGLTASFTSPNESPPVVESEASSGLVLPEFAAHYLAPSADGGTVIVVDFDQPVSGVAFDFATTDDPGVEVGSTVQLTAVDSLTLTVVGTAIAHGTPVPGASHPTGSLTFNSETGFDSIRIELAGYPLGAQQLMIDNLIVSLAGSTGGSMLLANPDWNITLTDYGYSDYLLDNTPGFEGREYLSGEWGTAVSYVKNGQPVSPAWLEPDFLFPDWRTNSTFAVVQGIHLAGTNVDGLPIAESILANDDLEVTLRFEMVDTVTGTPMGLKAASEGGAGQFASSNRYVLSQTCRVRNISGESITNVQIYQLMHGFISDRGVYDSRTYAGKLSQYHYDVTLAGIDTGSAGQGSSAEGFEDYITFHSKVAPTAFEVGHYGLENGGVDDHTVGKPSDGVHLSIENDWQDAPYAARQGRDFFQPDVRWIAGGQRWPVGNLAAGQAASLDIVLSLLTGTKVSTTGGGGSSGSCNGGASHIGGLDFEFEDHNDGGTFFGDYSEADGDELFERENEGEFAAPDFALPGGGITQLWDLKFNGTYTGLIHLTFAYNPALLPAGFDESTLAIYHFTGTVWEKLDGTVDTASNTIRVSTGSLSPFALGVFTAPPGITIPDAPGGTVTGAGSYADGEAVTLTATPADGWEFNGWFEAGAMTSPAATLAFPYAGPRTLTPDFVPILVLGHPAPGSVELSWPADANAGWVLRECDDLSAWVDSPLPVTTIAGRSRVTPTPETRRGFYQLVRP